MSNFLKKNRFWILIVLLFIIGSYFVLNKEGMSLESVCYYRKSDGAKICVKGDSSCTYYPDGTTKCTQGKRVCSQFTNCGDCTDTNNKPLGGRCFWNPKQSICSSRLEKGFLPSCRIQPQMQRQAYVPVITLLPTTTLTNAAPLNSYLL